MLIKAFNKWRDSKAEEADRCGEMDIVADMRSDVPVVFLKLKSPGALLVIAADGSACLFEGGYRDSDFDTFRTAIPEPLHAALAQPIVMDLQQELSGAKNGSAAMQLYRNAGKYALLGLSDGAKQRLSIPADKPLIEIAQDAMASGGGAGELVAAIEDFVADFDDPLFCPEDSQTWDGSEVTHVEEIVLDVMSLHPSFDGGLIELRSRTDDEDAMLLLEGEEVGPIAGKVFAILDILVDFRGRFQGVGYEYNDGAGGRLSGYDEKGATVFEIEVDEPSQHERLAARQRLTSLLDAAGVNAPIIDVLLNVEQPSQVSM